MNDLSRTPYPSFSPDKEALTRVMESLKGIRFGSVAITIHEGQMVHIDRIERFRLGVSPRCRAPAHKTRT